MVTIGTVSVVQAALLQNNRPQCKVKDVNITGRVCGLSHCNRIKKDLVFLVSLSDEDTRHVVHIIIKRRECLQWEKDITPGDIIIITHLRPTTLYKNEEREARVFAVTSQSELYRHGNVTTTQVSTQDILDECNELDMPLPASKPDLISYQGTVTKVICPVRHVYILDDRITVYLKFTSTMGLCVLGVGSEVQLHGCHRIYSGKPSKSRLVACHRTCVKVINHSEGSKAELPLYMCRESPTTIDDLMLQLMLEDTFAQKFSRNLPSGAVDFVYNHAKQELPKCEREELSSRHMVLEYLHHKTCPATQTDPNSAATWRDIVTLSQLTALTSHADSEHKAKMSRCYGTAGGHGFYENTKNLNKKTYWHHVQWTEKDEPFDNWVVCGVLRVDKDTCQVQLWDQTAAIECVIAEPSNTHNNLNSTQDPIGASSSSSVHESCPNSSENSGKIGTSSTQNALKCTQVSSTLPDLSHFAIRVDERQVESSATTEKDVQKRKKYRLSFQPQHSTLCPALINKLIIVKRFTFVVEHFVLNRYESIDHIGDDKYVDDVGYRCYLMFSMRDVEVHPENLSGRFLRMCTFLDGEYLQAQKFRLIDKECLHLQQRCTRASLAFYATVELCGTVEKRSSQEMLKCPHEKPSTTEKDNGSDVRLLVFTGRCAAWFPMLNPGSCYWLVSAKPEPGRLLEQTLPTAMQQAVSRTGARTCVSVPDDVAISLHTQNQNSKNVIRDTNILSVSRLLTLDTHKQLVSVVGRLISHRFESSSWQQEKMSDGYKKRLKEENSKFGVSVPGGFNLVLVLQDLHVPTATINVYYHSDRISYPLGLLPGATVAFYKLQVKLSQTDRLYANYILVSSHWILHLPNPHSLSEVPEQPSDSFDDRPVTLICDLWLEGSRSFQSKVISCHIQQITKLEINCVCSLCGCLWQHQRCSSERCSATGQPVISAKSSVMVDDGTGTAMAHVNNTQTISHLLLLTPSEWAEIEDHVTSLGHVSIAQHGETEEPVSMFLRDLVNSDRVRRTVSMSVKRFSSFVTPSGEKRPNLHECLASDFPIAPVDLGRTFKVIHTRSLPWLQLECLHVK